MKKGVPANYGKDPYTFHVDVHDSEFDKTVTSTVSITVKDLTEEAVFNSGGVRLQGRHVEDMFKSSGMLMFAIYKCEATRVNRAQVNFLAL